MSRSAARAAFAAIIESGVIPVSGHVKSQVPWPALPRPSSRDRQIYHGPLLIPERIADEVWARPLLRMARGNRPVLCFDDCIMPNPFAPENREPIKFRFMRPIPVSRAMMGEIVIAPDGSLRVHAQREITDPHVGPFCDPSAIMARKAESQTRRTAGPPIMPPLAAPWSGEAEYADPKYAEQIMAESLLLEDRSGKL